VPLTLCHSTTYNTPSLLPNPCDISESDAWELIHTLALNTMQAQNNFLAAKVALVESANHWHGEELVFHVGDRVLLSTKHRHQEYMQSTFSCIAKFMLHYDGPFEITYAHPETSN